MNDFATAAAFLQSRAGKGYPCPRPQEWAQFYKLILRHRSEGAPTPPISLILGGASSTNASKAHRLEEQLRWAADHDCLEPALDFLLSLDDAQWVESPKEDWSYDPEGPMIEAMREHLREEYGEDV